VWTQTTPFGVTSAYQQFHVPFNSQTSTTVTIFFGFQGFGSDGWIQVDDLTITPE
jgi:hypothetical protein